MPPLGGIGGLLASAVANASTLSLANRLFALVVGGVALAFTARSLVRVLWIVHRLIWRVEATGNPSLWAPLILVGFVTALFGSATWRPGSARSRWGSGGWPSS